MKRQVQRNSFFMRIAGKVDGVYIKASIVGWTCKVHTFSKKSEDCVAIALNLL